MGSMSEPSMWTLTTHTTAFASLYNSVYRTPPYPSCTQTRSVGATVHFEV